MSIIDALAELGSGPPWPLRPWCFAFSRKHRAAMLAGWRKAGKAHVILGLASLALVAIAEGFLVLVATQGWWGA